jgi:hypothetical protein
LPDGVYVVEQALVLALVGPRVQEAVGVKLPGPPLVKATVPTGADFPPVACVSVTVAVQVAAWLIATLPGVHETVVEVARRVTTIGEPIASALLS